MAWNKSGAERVKSYRVYQELETQYNEALEEIASLRSAINVKDELIRRLAAEIAETSRPVRSMVVPASSGSGERRAVRSYASVDDGTSEYDDVVEDEPVDGLTAIRTPAKKLKPSLS